MKTLRDVPVVITGGSNGLGLATVEALVAQGARVTIVARDRMRLAEVAKRMGASARPGDATDAALMDAVVAEVQPRALILNAGAMPQMGPIDEQSWESFCAVWNTDVKAGLYGIQAALKTPLPAGGRVLIVSGGFAVGGAPLGGSSAGGKRMLWWMARYATLRARELGLDLQFQALLPLQPRRKRGSSSTSPPGTPAVPATGPRRPGFCRLTGGFRPDSGQRTSSRCSLTRTLIRVSPSGSRPTPAKPALRL